MGYLPEVAVVLPVVHETLMDVGESVAEVSRNPFLEFLRSSVFDEVLISVKLLLELLRQLRLDISGHLVPVCTMAVAHDKQVEALLSTHVGCQRISVLVNLVGVTRLMATGRRKSELGDGVESLI